MDMADLNALNVAGGRVHLVGICGVGMAGLAALLKARGLNVSGCDGSRNALADWLEAQGVPVYSGHDPAHLEGVKVVIRTTAVAPTHPEIAAARDQGIPVFQRGAVLAALVAPAIANGGPAELVATGVTLVAYLVTKNLFLAMIAGVLAVVAARMLLGA